MSDVAALISIVTENIHRAFDGVLLGDGVSLLQAEVIDRYGEGCTDKEFEEMKQSEVVNDWSKVSLRGCKNFCVNGHLAGDCLSS